MIVKAAVKDTLGLDLPPKPGRPTDLFMEDTDLVAKGKFCMKPLTKVSLADIYPGLHKLGCTVNDLFVSAQLSAAYKYHGNDPGPFGIQWRKNLRQSHNTTYGNVIGFVRGTPLPAEPPSIDLLQRISTELSRGKDSDIWHRSVFNYYKNIWTKTDRELRASTPGSLKTSFLGSSNNRGPRKVPLKYFGHEASNMYMAGFTSWMDLMISSYGDIINLTWCWHDEAKGDIDAWISMLEESIEAYKSLLNSVS
jgi:hypothetical protein